MAEPTEAQVEAAARATFEFGQEAADWYALCLADPDLSDWMRRRAWKALNAAASAGEGI